jgi:hypothetical protein
MTGMKPSLVLSLLIFFVVPSYFAACAQSIPKIPKDLEITLTGTSRFENYSINIRSNGSWKSDGQFGLPTGDTKSGLLSAPKGKVAKTDLQWLISAFKNVDFLHFNKSHPMEEGVVRTSISEQATEIISFRADGETARLTNYLGDQDIRTELLQILANKIRRITTLSETHAVIPKDFVATFGDSSVASATYYRIGRDGRIEYCYYSNMPERRSEPYFLLLGQKKPKAPKYEARLSTTRLDSILSNINRSDFFGMRDGILGKSEGCKNDGVTEHGTVYGITIRKDGITRRVSMDKNCDPVAGSKADEFYRLYLFFSESIRGVTATRVEQKEFFKD